MTGTLQPAVLSDTRRYDIDWLRVLAFMLLIYYHIGMFYVYDWGWHVKSAYQSEFLQNLMLLLNRWRMPLIFLISGVALSLIEPKINAMKLLKMRFVRVFLPLVIGMYLIVPPQLYFELIQKEGFEGSYWQFFSFYIDASTSQFPNHQHSSLGLLTWNHLWYLAYLWHYTLVYLLLRPLLLKINWQSIDKRLGAGKLFIVIVGWLVVAYFWLKADFPKTNALVDDWFNHAVYFSVFSLGYLIAKCSSSWEQISQHRRKFLIGAIIGYVCTLILHNDRLTNFLISLDVDVETVGAQFEVILAIYIIICANVVCWLFALLGYAAQYLRKNNRFLAYMNEAVLPWYILHQSIIVIVAMSLARFSLGPVWEPMLVIIFTFGGCAAGYELIKRFSLTRFIFGMKLKGPEQKPLLTQQTSST